MAVTEAPTPNPKTINGSPFGTSPSLTDWAKATRVVAELTLPMPSYLKSREDKDPAI